MKTKMMSLIILAALFAAPLANASVESSLLGLKSVLLGSILPIFEVL